MADEKGGDGYLAKLEDLCVRFIRANVNCWKPEDFLGMPRHLLFAVLEKIHPFEIERLEVSGIFQRMGIDTDPLWRNVYVAHWPRKRKWPEIYFKTKGITREQECWRVYCLQRHLQEALNSYTATCMQSSSSSEAVTDHQDLQHIVSVCGKYASYLRLYSPACICLAKNWDICLQLSEYVEFLEVFLLRDKGVESLCFLLQVFASNRLKSVGFCFCKVNNIQMWGRIIGSLSRINHQKVCGTRTDLACGISIAQNTEASTRESDKSHMNQVCNQLDHEQNSKTTFGKGSQTVQAGDNKTENINFASLQSINELDIYEFADSSDNHVHGTDKSSAELSRRCHSCLHQSGTSEISPGISFDLYDEVFGYSDCGHSSGAPKELAPINEQQQLTVSTSEQHKLIIPGPVKLQSPLLSLPNLECSLVHFELLAFWLHQELLELFLNSLEGWLNLESLALEDNGLGLVLVHPSESQKFINTLSFLCTKGRLRSLKITNNLVGDSEAKFIIEKLVGSFCGKCNKNSKSLAKLKFSSYQVTEAFSAYLGRAITDFCVCELSSDSSTVERLGCQSCTSEKSTESKEISMCSFHEGRHDVACEDDCNKGRWTSAFVQSSSAATLESVSTSLDSNTSNKGFTQAGCNVKHACSCKAGSHSLCNNDWNEERKGTCTKSTFDSKKIICDAQKTSDKTELHIVDCEQKSAAESSEGSSQRARPVPFSSHDTSVFAGIEELRLTCPIWDRGASLIADGLQRNSSLHSLSLVRCDISTAGLGDIFQAVSGNRFLKRLSVKGNHYDPRSNGSLAEMLATNNTLTHLDLGNCRLGAYVTKLGMKIIHALCINSALTSLKLNGNRLGDAHVTGLSQVFSHPTQLSKITKLDLSNNPISLECLSVLASSLQCIKPRKLDELKLTGNVLGAKPHQVLSSLRTVVRSVIAEHLDKATLFADFISQM